MELMAFNIVVRTVDKVVVVYVPSGIVTEIRFSDASYNDRVVLPFTAVKA
jgi:hypothetical protein